MLTRSFIVVTQWSGSIQVLKKITFPALVLDLKNDVDTGVSAALCIILCIEIINAMLMILLIFLLLPAPHLKDEMRMLLNIHTFSSWRWLLVVFYEVGGTSNLMHDTRW